MMKQIPNAVKAFFLIGSVTITAGCSQTKVLSKQKYIDKCKGAWAGQMIGVCYGAPYEFHFNGRPITIKLKPWTPDRVAGAIGQDDCYVEMTFLNALEKYGLDITYEQAGKEFADSKYGLAHANNTGRENCRHGIMPPLSGHPKYNRHADDIDFQIEADLLGIICPGLPRESNRLCDIFGHIMNYGDGVYGGMFVAGMYAAAYFEDRDVRKVLQAGLDCIPAESQYHKCIFDVIKWHKENPDDWLATWNKLEKKWQDNIDCRPNDPFNIDAKINGAYIAVGLLYGNGDFLKTIEISTRCGQDADCNPSSAAGVLGCMKGYSALDEQMVGGIPAIEDKNFAFTNYSFKTLIPACQRVTEKIILRAGGEITGDAYVIPPQSPKAPEELEQWTNQMEILSIALSQKDVEWWDPAWKVLDCGHYMDPGLRSEHNGRTNVLIVHPVSQEKPAVMTAEMKVPSTGKPKLSIDISSHRSGDFELKVLIDNKIVKETIIDTKGQWINESIDISEYSGKIVNVRLEFHANNWHAEAAYLDKVEIK